MKIPDIGLRKEWIYEVIITCNGNAAPVGILTRDFESVEMELYKTSKTCENILRDGEFVINFSDDMETFYNCIFNKEAVVYEENHLKGADAFIKMRVTEKEDIGNRIKMRAIPVEFKIIKAPRLVNRARSLTLEGLIAKTKIPHLPSEEKEFLEKKIQKNLRVVRKVAPNSKYERIMERL